jgi:hypothetical protein
MQYTLRYDALLSAPVGLQGAQSNIELFCAEGAAEGIPLFHQIQGKRLAERWYAQNIDVDRVILSLCTYVGHETLPSPSSAPVITAHRRG